MTDPQPQKKSAYEALSIKHRRFVDAYFEHHLNATKAARAVGYRNPKEGKRLRDREDISAAIAEESERRIMSSAETRHRLSMLGRLNPDEFIRAVTVEREVWLDARRDERVHELAKRRGVPLAEVDELDLASEFGDDAIARSLDGRLMVRAAVAERTLETDWEAAEEAGAFIAIRKLKKHKDGSVEVEFHDVVRALELIGKTHGAFVDRQEVSGANGAPLQFEIMRRVVHVQEGGGS